MKTVLLGLSLAGLAFAYTTPAQADCQCVAAGKKYHIGEVACLNLPQGKRLARCSMVLNNSSWEKLEDSCPLAFNDTAQMSTSADMADLGSGHDVPHSHVRISGAKSAHGH